MLVCSLWFTDNILSTPQIGSPLLGRPSRSLSSSLYWLRHDDSKPFVHTPVLHCARRLTCTACRCLEKCIRDKIKTEDGFINALRNTEAPYLRGRSPEIPNKSTRTNVRLVGNLAHFRTAIPEQKSIAVYSFKSPTGFKSYLLNNLKFKENCAY